MGAVSAAESAIAGIGLATSLFGRHEQAQAQEEAIRLRLEQEEAANVERSTQRAHRLNEVMAAQVAREGASGLSVASPSFFAVGADSFNQFAEDENADAINLSFDKIQAANQENSIQNSNKYGIFGDIFHTGTALLNSHVFKSSTPASPITQSQQPPMAQEQIPGPVEADPFKSLFKGTDLEFIL